MYKIQMNAHEIVRCGEQFFGMLYQNTESRIARLRLVNEKEYEYEIDDSFTFILENQEMDIDTKRVEL